MKIKSLSNMLLFFILSVVLCGCTSNNNEKSYTYSVEHSTNQSTKDNPNGDNGFLENHKIYMKGNKWRQEIFLKNKNTPYMVVLFNGSSMWGNANVSVHFPIPATRDDGKLYSQEEARSFHTVYPLLNWDKLDNRSPFNYFKTNSYRAIGETKSKFGYKCTMYQYGPITSYIKEVKQKQVSTRNVCVSKEYNMAVSIEHIVQYSDGSVSRNQLNLKNISTEEIPNSMFSALSLFKVVK